MKIESLTLEINIKPESIEDIKNILESDISTEEMASKLFELKNTFKQLTLDELQKQFEKQAFHRDLSKMEDGDYLDNKTSNEWVGYQQCAKANGILK